MAESSPPSPKATPKRKRGDLSGSDHASSLSLPLHTNTLFTFEAPKVSDILDDGNSSPRSKVANRLRDLALVESGVSGVATTTPADTHSTSQDAVRGKEDSSLRSKFPPESAIFGFDGAHKTNQMQIDEEDGNVTRKRMKLPAFNPAAHTTSTTKLGGNGESYANVVPPVLANGEGKVTLQTAVDPVIVKTARPGVVSKLQKSYPSINRLADSKSRRNRRAGTPPLSSSCRKIVEGDVEEDPVIVDPIRAALTWHEDEITVYDAEDKDDDGTGLNGIGFKPTPAVAYARAQKRRQQLSEYRKREEKEARARRNQRRREQLGEGSELKRKHSLVRVRFSDAEPNTMVTT